MAVVLVTGCSSGIGLETALAFARRGDRVLATMRDVSRGDRLRAAVERENLPVVIRPLDVTDGDAITNAVAEAIANEGRIDVLVNNAGIGGRVSAVEEIDEAVARSVWETNFWGPFRLIRAVLPSMRRHRSGVIVNLSTFGVRLPGGPGLGMYVTSKAAVSRLTEGLQTELTGTGVRAVVIEPGFFATEIYNNTHVAIDSGSPYASMVRTIDEAVATGVTTGADPADVALAIIAAVDDEASPTSVLVGDDAHAAFDEHRRQLIKAWGAELEG